MNLNESAMNFVKRVMQKQRLTEGYDLYILKDGVEKKLKSSKNIKPIKKTIDGFVADPSKLEDIGATELFAIDNSKDKDNEIFVFASDEDNTWEVVYDNIPSEFSSEYADTLLNRVYYSLTETKPENFSAYAEPGLKKNILKTTKGIYAKDGDEAGYIFKENGDAVITVSFDPNVDRSASKEWIEEVANHYGLNLIRRGKNTFRIILPDQAKYYGED